jgi:hypothetical protein
MIRLRHFGWVGCLVALAAAPSPAAGQPRDPGVVLDPEGPAGREYAVPFEEERREAGGGGGTGARGSARIFGIGIGPQPRAKGGSGGPADRSGSPDAGRGSDAASGRDGTASGEATEARGAASFFLDDRPSGLPWTLGIAAAAALLAGSIGALIRRAGHRQE